MYKNAERQRSKERKDARQFSRVMESYIGIQRMAEEQAELTRATLAVYRKEAR
jgi:hypothetical protein